MKTLAIIRIAEQRVGCRVEYNLVRANSYESLPLNSTTGKMPVIQGNEHEPSGPQGRAA